MTKVRVLCAVLLLVGGALAQRWVTPAETTSFRFTRFDGEYFPGTGKVYFLGGRLGTTGYPTDSTVWSYDPSTRTYANTGQVLPRAISNYDICLVRDMYNPPTDSYGLYVIGGRLAATGLGTDTIQVYYPMSNTVRKLLTDQYPGRVNTYIPSAIGAVVAGNKIYVTGGFTTQDYTPSNLAYVFDPLASAGARWTQLSNLNFARAYVAGAVIDDTLVYAIGGDSSYPSTLVPKPRVERLNTMNTGAGWTQVRDMQMACDETRAYAFQKADSLLGLSRKIVVAGTGQWPAEVANCHLYHVTGDSWTAFPNLDSARRNHAGAYIPGTATTNGVPGIWVWGGRKTTDVNLLKTPEYYALGLNVGVTKIDAPTGSVDSGAVVTPACSVYNYGLTSATYDVLMKIAGFDFGVATVTDHAPGTRVYVTFPSWTAEYPRGTYATACSTQYAGDLDQSNDKQTGTVTIDVHDVGTKVLLAPSGTITAGTVVTPACSVFNLGSVSETYNVRLKIGSVYDQISPVAGHAAGATLYVTFPNWTATAGTHAVSCSTELAADSFKANDKQTGSVIVTGGGGGGGWSPRVPMPIFPSGKNVKDGGWITYDDTTKLIFGAKGNKQVDFYAYHPLGDSWHQRASMPRGSEDKPPSKGAVGVSDGNGYIYATKGNNTQGYYMYDATKDSWYQKANVPFGISGKKVKGGTSLVVAPSSGAQYVYLLKGYKNEFYKYFPLGDSWHTLPPAPIGANVKWNKGSWIAYCDLRQTIFAHKSKYHELYSFNTLTDLWDTNPLTPMPIPGSGGTKKSKDGGCATVNDSTIYAFKGANTQEFWKYSIPTNTWAELETIPRGPFKKRVKNGASLTTMYPAVPHPDRPGTPADIPALKGNKTNELWIYTIVTPPVAGSVSDRDGVAAEKRPLGEPFLTLAPNPLTGGFARLQYSLPGSGLAVVRVYDVTGRSVLPAALITGRTGTAVLDLRSLDAGVYLLKAEGSGFATVRKLVVER